MKIEHKRGSGQTTRAIVEVIHSLIVEDQSCTVLILSGWSPGDFADKLKEHLKPFAPARSKGRLVTIESARTGKELTVEVCGSFRDCKRLGDDYTLILDT